MKDKPLQWLSHKGSHAGKIQQWDHSKQPRGYTPFMRACIEACANNTIPPIKNDESLRAVRVVYSIYEAARTGTKVNIR